MSAASKKKPAPKKGVGDPRNRAQRRAGASNVTALPGQQPQVRRVSPGEVAEAWNSIAKACDEYPCSKKERQELERSLSLIQGVVTMAAQQVTPPTPTKPAEPAEDTETEEEDNEEEDD